MLFICKTEYAHIHCRVKSLRTCIAWTQDFIVIKGVDLVKNVTLVIATLCSCE